MAVAISGKNYTIISGCESMSDGGTWTFNKGEIDGGVLKQDTYSLVGILNSSGDNDAYVTKASGYWDCSGAKHLRMWVLTTVGGVLNTDAAGGLQFSVSDGTNTGYYYVSGINTYPGGWYNLVVDLSGDTDAGTKPPDMSLVTRIGVRMNLTDSAKNALNFWIDHLCLCDGLIAKGDSAGAYFNFSQIQAADEALTGGWGVLRKISGQYFSTGSLEIGSSTGDTATKFQAKSQVLVFEDRRVNTSLYKMLVVDYGGTNATEFILGDKVGTAGIQGCTIRVADSSQTAKFAIDGSTDTDIDNFKLYGSVFYGANSITFPSTAAAVEILGCSFESCGQVLPDDASVKSCFFINTSNVDAALLWNESINVTYCSFIGNEAGAGIEMPSAVGSPYSYSGLLFSGNTYDALNSSGSPITVNKTNLSDPSSWDPSGDSIYFAGSVTVEITVINENGDSVFEAQTAVYLTSTGDSVMNKDTDLAGVATESYSGSIPADIYIRIRKSSTGATKYKPYNATGKITSSGFYSTVTLIEDPIAM